MTNIINKITAYICQELAPDIDPNSLPNNYNLLKTGVIDSLSLIRFITWIEEEYDIPMGNIDIAPEDFSSVLSVSAFITKHTVITA